MVAPNYFGALLGLWYTLATIRFASSRVQNTIMGIVVGLLGLLLLGGAISFIYLDRLDHQTALILSGSMCVAVLSIFYSSPLSTMYHVVKTRNSESIAPRLAIACLLNGCLWAVYGIVTRDWFITAPNSAGAILSIIQLVLKAVYPEKPRSVLPSVRAPSLIQSDTAVCLTT